MFLIKLAQTNSDITDNYFQFGEEKKYPQTQKDSERTFKPSAMGLKHSPPSWVHQEGNLKKLNTPPFEMASLSGEQI